MRRLRHFVNATTYLVAIVITVWVSARVIRQLAYGETPPISAESAGFREYQEARAAKRREDWALISQLTKQDIESWPEAKQAAVLNGLMQWLDEGTSFDLYFRRLSNEEIETMQDNLTVLAVRWLEKRVTDYARAAPRDKNVIIQQDTMRAINLALMLGRLDGPFGPGLMRGKERIKDVEGMITEKYGYFSPARLTAMAYFSALFKNITNWQENGGWEELRRRADF